MRIKNTKPRNLVAKDLRSPKYRMRVAVSAVRYDRKKNKKQLEKEMSYG
jgi:hypothetical protein